MDQNTPETVRQLVAEIHNRLKPYVGRTITGPNQEQVIQELVAAAEAGFAAMGIIPKKHFTVNVHPPKSRRKRRQGIYKVVVRPLPRHLRAVAIPCPVHYIEITHTLTKESL